MALNFPPVNSADGNPTNGLIWTAPNGQQWIYRESIKGWQSLKASGNSNIIYRGGIDLTKSPTNQYNNIESGNEFIVTVGSAFVDPTLYPGLGGKVVGDGAITRYDGNEWQVTNSIPYATEIEPGIVELATESEVDSLSPTRVLTPVTGKYQIDKEVPQATTSEVGRTRYSTANEADAGQETEAALTPYSIKNILDRIDAIETASDVDTGLIMWFAGLQQFIPTGWLICDGRQINDTGITADLYTKLKAWGNPWGPGPTSSTVRVPDLRGVFIRGHDPRLFSQGGRNPDNTQFGGYQNDQWRSHTHGVSDPGHRHSISGNGYSASNNSPNEDVIIDNNLGVPRNSSINFASTGISIQSNGGNETRSKNVNLTPIIKL
jgi:microcystin-dependent protein